MTDDEQPVKSRNELHKEVLSGIVTTNGFFTGAAFLSVTGSVTPMPGISSNCVAGEDIIFRLFFFQLWSIGLYLMSSLIAMAGKAMVVYFDTDPSRIQFSPPMSSNMSWRGDSGEAAHHPGSLAKILVPFVRPVMIMSVLFSAAGSTFLLLSVINLVQIKLGLMSCGSPWVVSSVVGIAALITLGLGFYLYISWYVFKYVK